MAWTDAARAAALEVRRRKALRRFRRFEDLRDMRWSPENVAKGREYERRRWWGKAAFRTNEGYGRTEVAYPLNRALGEGRSLSSAQQEVVRHLDRTIRQGRMRRDTILFHGGETHTGGYLSTSSKPKRAARFGPLRAILVPKGTPYAVGDYHEREVILPRGGRLVAVGKSRKGVPILRFQRRK